MRQDIDKKSYKVGFKVRRNRLLCWLIVLLTILLAVAIGIFVFLSLNAKYHFACVMGCEQPEGPAAIGQLWASTATSVPVATQQSFETSSPEIRKSEKPTQKQAVNTEKTTTVIKINRDTIIRSRTPAIIRSSAPSTSAIAHSSGSKVNTAETTSRSHGRFTTARGVTTPASTLNLRTTAKPSRSQNNYINITGKITFQAKAPKRLPRNSRLTVEFKDVSRMDAAAILLARTVVDLSQYRRGRPLFYTIICKRPELAHRFYSISAVLNVGWKARAKEDDWIRKGDYFNDMFLKVHIKKRKSVYERNIQLIKY